MAGGEATDCSEHQLCWEYEPLQPQIRLLRNEPTCSVEENENITWILISLILERAHFEWVLWIQNESNRDGQSNHNKISHAENKNQEKKHVTDLSQARKSSRDQIAVGFDFNASDWTQKEGGARFLDQLQSEVHANLNSCGPGWLSTLIWKLPEYIVICTHGMAKKGNNL